MKNEKSRKPSMKHFIVKLDEGKNAKYTKEELVDILSDISFELINITLSAKKSYLGLNGQGYSAIGFVNSFDPEEESFKVVVFENKAKYIEDLEEIVIVPRVFTNKEGKITKVIGLDVEPVSIK